MLMPSNCWPRKVNTVGIIKRLLDHISPWVPPIEVQEAEKENIKYDRAKVDVELDKLIKNKDEFVDIVNHLTRTLNARERKEGNGG